MYSFHWTYQVPHHSNLGFLHLKNSKRREKIKGETKSYLSYFYGISRKDKIIGNVLAVVRGWEWERN